MVVAEPSIPVPEALGECHCGRCNASQGLCLRNIPSDGFGINLHHNGQQISTIMFLGQGLAGCFTFISIVLLTNELSRSQDPAPASRSTLRLNASTLTELLGLKIKMIQKVALAGVSIRAS